MNSKQQRKQVIRIAMSAMEINKKRLSESLGWSYPTTLKKLKSPNKLRVDELEQLCEMINLDPVKFIKQIKERQKFAEDQRKGLFQISKELIKLFDISVSLFKSC